MDDEHSDVATKVAGLAQRIADASRGRTGSLDERAIHDAILSVGGAELTALKNQIDFGDDHRDLQHVVYSDIDDDHLRASILAHIASEAATLDGASPREAKILSDIDDTFYCNWKDERFPKKTVYPGVRQLYIELDRGPNDEHGREGDIAFVTARPKDRTGFVERLTHRALRGRGVPSPVVLAGSIRALHSSASIAKRKLRNFHQYAALFPEYDFVFIGDSGQGDAEFGARMRESDAASVRAILIHDVVGSDDAVRASWAERGVFFFDTYVGAAIEAHELGLIQSSALTRVSAAALEEFAAITFDDPAKAGLRRAELERDIARLGS